MQVVPKLTRTVAVPSFILGISLLLQAAALEAQTAVYRCAGTNGVVYSDLPCDAATDPVQVDDSRITLYTPTEVTAGSSTQRTSATAARQPKKKRTKAAAESQTPRTDCARLDERLREVRAKLRAGYDVREGERLKARQRQLNEQRRAQKC
jgi:flagellar motility protein MotE (MotC chaperone)